MKKVLPISPKAFLAMLVTAAVAVVLTACGASKQLPEGEYSLEKVSMECDDENFNASALSGYIRQRPNTKWFSLIKKPGAAPVVYDSLLAAQSCQDLLMAMQNMGYLHARVTMANQLEDNKLNAVYQLHPGEMFYVRDVSTDIEDENVATFLEENKRLLTQLKPGARFMVPMLNDERKRITSLLTSNGYYKFHKDFISFDVDTAANSTDVDVAMRLQKYRANDRAEEELHPVYHIRNINYLCGDGEKMHLRPRVLENTTAFRSGDLYSSSALQRTYNNFARMQAIRYTNIRFTEVPDTTLLDCDIQLSTNKPSTISFLPEGTNTAGDLGAAASVTYENRNLFQGSELLSLQGRVAYEAISGLEGYSEKNYQEYSLESKLTFPRFVAPLLTSNFRRSINATTEFSLAYNLQNRPEFHRTLFSAAWRYKWNSASGRTSYRLDLLDLNYVYMPWISKTFREDYLESTDNRNAILRYNYENLFIMKVGFVVNINRSNWALRTNVETSGNLLGACAQMMSFYKTEEGQYAPFHIAYAQYAKGDIDYTKLINFDENNQLAMHAAFGIAYPYGNSTILPFEKRYFSGGANSVRGWSVRSLGPGRFRGTDGRIDFINQTGDIKLDFSVEYRTKLFWKFSGAVFVDAGNIWTLRDYADQPDGQFKFDEFYKQIAVAYGAGLRMNFGYFILRFDLGVKALNPTYTTTREHLPLLHPSLRRDLAFHFAVGLPF